MFSSDPFFVVRQVWREFRGDWLLFGREADKSACPFAIYLSGPHFA